MNFSEKVDRLRNKAQEAQAANKIIDSLKKIELDNNENTSYRWIWELIQNAKDVTNSTGTVDILIDFDEHNRLIKFSHNGKLFSTQNIVFLIEQVSTKDREEIYKDKKKTTGKFGTGFLTTHLLSKKVNVSGYIQDDDDATYSFNIDIDRTSDKQSEIINSISESCSQLEKNAVEVGDKINEINFNTCFTYLLDECGIGVAKKGLNNLIMSIAYVFAFVPEINSITVNAKTFKSDYNQKIVREEQRGTQLEKGSVVAIENTINAKTEKIYIFVLSDDEEALLSIACEIIHDKKSNNIKKFSEKLPKLFCDFPLLGTENFSFPVVINCALFNPTEPRDGIHLTKKDVKDVNDNKACITRSIALYKKLLEYLSLKDYRCLYNLTKITTQEEKSWLDLDWFEENVTKVVKNDIIHCELINTLTNDKQPLVDEWCDPCILLPNYPNNQTVREAVWELSSKLFPEKLPTKEELHDWSDSLWDECKNLYVQNLIDVVEEAITLNSLAERVNGNVIQWLNNLYSLVYSKDLELYKSLNSEPRIILNQNGVFCKLKDLLLDNNIDEEYKTAGLLLDKLDVKSKLIDNAITLILKSNVDLSTYFFKDYISEMQSYLQNSETDNYEFLQRIACLKSAENKSQNQFLAIASLIYKQDNWNTIQVKQTSKYLIDYAINQLTEKICYSVSETIDIGRFSQKYFEDSQENAISWINQLTEYLCRYDSGALTDKYAVLPNQNYVFKKSSTLTPDSGDIDNVIKDAYKLAGVDIRETLLLIEVCYPLPEHNLDIYSIAEKITRYVEQHKNKLGANSKDEEITFNSLFSLLKTCPEKSTLQKAFKELISNLYWFYNDDTISENMHKVEKYEQMLSKYGISDMHALEGILQQADNNSSSNDYNISKEQLSVYGIKSEQDLFKLLNIIASENGGSIAIDELSGLSIDEVSNNFIHNSIRKKYSFDYYQQIMERAIKNVFEYLKKTQKYEISDSLEDWQETSYSPTVFLAKKDGLEIRIVVRPSDNDKIIFYYEQEVAAVDDTAYELWTDNGQGNTRMITLGDIIKTTGISVIPLKNLNPK